MEHLAVDGDSTLFLDINFLFAELVGFYRSLLHLDLHGVASYDAAFAPSTGHKSSVAGHTAACGKDTVGSTHTLDILGVGFLTDEDVLNTGSLVFLGFLAGEGYYADSAARTCGQTFCQNLVFLLVSAVENGVQQLVELGR